MVKFLLVAVALFVVYKLFTGDFRHKQKVEDKAEQAQKAAAGELVKDPICGTYIALDGGISVRDGEKIYRFCSYECRDKFLKQIQQGREIETDKKDGNAA